MTKNNFLQNSSKFLTVLALGSSLFLNVSGLAAPLVADNDTQVVVDSVCDLAIKVDKQVDYAGLTDFLPLDETKYVSDWHKEYYNVRNILPESSFAFYPKEPKPFGPGVALWSSCYNQEYSFEEFNLAFERTEEYY